MPRRVLELLEEEGLRLRMRQGGLEGSATVQVEKRRGYFAFYVEIQKEQQI